MPATVRPRYADLVRRLQDLDPCAADKAFDALLFDRGEAVPDIAAAYGSWELPPLVRRDLIQLLGFSECPDAVATVEVALEDPAPTVRAEACRSLVDLRSRVSLPLIRRRLKDLDAEVRGAALDAVRALGRK
ncbi:MAG: HEAT repeat domain-containing protein [Deltaproteobacteria bacterium]|nr:HEAT repeat domain-containing protein [Deltaproteobacteria bacterium]